ncbi:ankyrin repeat domain-containing protein [Planctomycetota bacterium]
MRKLTSFRTVAVAIHLRLVCFTFFLVLLVLSCRTNDAARSDLPVQSRPVVALSWAVKHGDEQRLQKLLDSGVDIDAVGSFGTALCEAAYFGDVNAVRLLLEYGANPNITDDYGRTPLHAAAGIECIEHQEDDALKIVELLVSRGADVNAGITTDVDGTRGRTPLHEAASISYVSYDPVTDDRIVAGNIPVLEFLLAHGAQADARDASGLNALLDALISESVDAMRLLVAHGADVNTRDSYDGWTVLHHAAYSLPFEQLEAVQLLVSRGASIDARALDGETPLHKAALVGDMHIVNYLVKHGADLHASSRRGETPQDFLDEPNDPEPILISTEGDRPFALIVTDGLAIRGQLGSEGIDYDTIWHLSKTDTEGLVQALETWLNGGECAEGASAEYILSHFSQYNREYAGFRKNGIEYIICNMVQDHSDGPRLEPCNDFSGGFYEGSCGQVFVIFVAATKQVAEMRCGW